MSTNLRLSSSVCVRNKSTCWSTCCKSDLKRRYPGNELSDMRALTTAIRAPLAWAQPKEVGPEFSFRHDHEAGFQGLQIRPDGKSEIEREIENLLLAKSLTRQFLACIGGSGYYDAILGKLARSFSIRPLTASTSPTETACTQMIG